jgi:hypothetical protein
MQLFACGVAGVHGGNGKSREDASRGIVLDHDGCMVGFNPNTRAKQ